MGCDGGRGKIYCKSVEFFIIAKWVVMIVNQFGHRNYSFFVDS
jgi:hypothetical protein